MCPVWVELKNIENKRSEDASQKLREEQASLAAEAEKRRAEIRGSSN